MAEYLIKFSISGCNSGGVRKAAPIAETIKRQEGLVQ